MKIRSKVTLSFCVTVLLLSGVLYFSFLQGKTFLKEWIVADTFSHGRNALQQIEQSIVSRVKELQWLASSELVLKTLQASNAHFNALPQRDAYIDALDHDWSTKKETPLIESVLTDPLSQMFQEQLAFYQRTYGFPLFGEIFLTNQYGVVVATSDRTSDYKQSDEVWYQEGVSSSSWWMGDLEYDASSNMIVLDCVVHSLSASGEKLGVLKGALNINYLRSIVDQIQKKSQYQSIEIYLVDQNGFTLFSAIDPQLTEPGEDVALQKFGEKLSSYLALPSYIRAKNSSFIDKEKKRLFVLIHSQRSLLPRDLGWSFLISFKTEELFFPINQAAKTLIWICFVLVAASVILWAWWIFSFLNPIKKLEKGVLLFGQGKLEKAIQISSNDEVGQLAKNFNQMASDLNLLTKNLEKRVQERTQEIERKEKFTRSIIETANDAFVSMNEQGLITDWNKRAEEIFGWPRENVMGKKLAEMIIPLKYRDAFFQRIHAFLKTGKKEELYQRIEMMALHHDGHEFPVELTLWPIWEGKSCYFNSFIRDVSERKQLQEQFTQSQKMEGIGRLAGGVAHDFNNQLTAIVGYSQLLLDSLAEKDLNRQSVQEILNAANRSAKLTHQLLTFSRRGMIHPKRVNLNEVVMHLDQMLRRLVSENIELSVIPEEELGTVEIDPSQVEHILMNLVVNARDAMPQGGKVMIETKNVHLDEAYARRQADFLPGDYVLLAVSDTGVGMSKEVQSHLFEPFFTTKEKGKGTGLGLATCYGIIRQNKGHVLVYSELGVGTTLKVYFPRVTEEAQSLSEPKKEKSETVFHGDETILVTEDEISVRKMVVQILKSQGYHILEASNGEEALRVAQKHNGPIDLLFSDVVMPQMGGLELFEKIQKNFPEIKVLFTSGYTDEAILETGKLRHGVDFIHKPFSTAAVSSKIREILDTEKKKAA